MPWVFVVFHPKTGEVEVKGPWDSQEDAIRFCRGYARALKRRNPRKKYKFAVTAVAPVVYFDPDAQS